jgi:hypothetical protein
LAGIQTRVTDGLITNIKIGIGEIVGAAEALSDIVASEFNVNTAGPCTFGAVSCNEASDFTNDFIEVTRLATTD